MKIEEGITCMRCMPDKADLLPDGRYAPKDGGHPPYREYRLHRHWGPDDATVTCGKDIDGNGRCWGCDVIIPQLEKDARKADQLKKVGPQEQFVIQAAKYDTNTSRFKLPKLCYLSTGAGIPGKPGTNTVALRVLTKIVNTRKDYIDPVKGFNINIERTGTGLKTKYPSIEGDETPTKVPLAVLQAVVSLDTLLPKYDEEDMKALWYGRPRRERGESSSDTSEYVEDVPLEGEDAEMIAEEYAEDPPAEEGEYAEEPAEDAAEDYTEDAPSDDYVAEDVLEDSPPDDAPEEYSNDEDEPPPPQPPARRPAVTQQGRVPARIAPPATRPPARQVPPAKRPAPPPAKKPGRR